MTAITNPCNSSSSAGPQDKVLYFTRILQLINTSGQDAMRELEDNLNKPRDFFSEEYLLRTIIDLNQILYVENEEFPIPKNDLRKTLNVVERLCIFKIKLTLTEIKSKI